MDARELVALLAEEDRLQVVAALVLGARTLGEVTAATGLDARRAGKALTRLEENGLVSADAAGVRRVRVELLKDAARAAAEPAAPPGDHGTGDPVAEKVLRVFLRDGRLTSIPATRGKRLVVLDHLSRLFEPGVRYPEREVDVMLRAFHDDYPALRRYLVDEGFLSRAQGVYWRTGGSYAVD